MNDFEYRAITERLDSLLRRGQGRIFTFSIVVGSRACDGACPFCISRITGYEELPTRNKINKIRLGKAARLAIMRSATTVLFTGKGEPTLYPDEITEYLKELVRFEFPLIELQTNALQIGDIAATQPDSRWLAKGPLTLRHLSDWLALGLNTIAISVVDIDQEHNARTYRDPYPDLATTIDFLHQIGFSVRLCFMMQKDMVDDIYDINRAIQFCKDNRVEQSTFRPLRKPDKLAAGADEYGRYIESHGLDVPTVRGCREGIHRRGKHLLTIAHGAHAAMVYDVDGQNVCMSDCLTVEAGTDDIRTLILYSNGSVFFDWQYQGARIM